MYVNPSAYVYLVLLMWIPITGAAFAAMKPSRAAAFGVVVGIAFLPEWVAFDPPLLPAMDKNAFCMGAVLMGFAIFEPKRLTKAKPFRGVDLWFLFFFIGTWFTIKTNPDSYQYGGGLHWNGVDHFPIKYLPPLRLKDGVSMIIADLVDFYLPFFLGRVMLQKREDIEELLRMMCLVGCIYAPMMLFESVMAPTFHMKLYGYHSHSLAHAIRGSGFKPYCFLRGGLAVAMFEFMCIMACIACMRNKIRMYLGVPRIFALGTMVFALALSRNVAVLVYLAATMPLALLFSYGSLLRVSMLLCALFVSFPYLRANDIFPTEKILEIAMKVGEERHRSLAGRFHDEDILLEKAQDRPWFGWGPYARNRTFDEETGAFSAISDGEWVIYLGVRGYFGAVTWFAILTAPVVIAWKGVKKIASKPDRLLVGVIALGVATHAVDMLPNSAFNRLLFFFAGSLVGIVRTLQQPQAPRRTSMPRVALHPGAPGALPPGHPQAHPQAHPHGYPPGYPPDPHRR